MEASTIEIMNLGMRCLVDHLGIIDAERFISAIMREKFDYTKWQREYFDQIPDINHLAAEYEKEHPFQGHPKIVLGAETAAAYQNREE